MHEGNTTIKRLSSAEEQGRIQGGKWLLKATLVASGSNEANHEDQRPDKEFKNGQVERLLDFAIAENLLFDFKDHNRIGEYLGNGAEQYVYMKDYQPYVLKFNNLKFHENPLEYFDRLALHNHIFPEAPYTLIGFSRKYPNEDCFSAVVTQPFVIAQRGADREEVKAEMIKMGFEHVGGNTYVSPDYIVEDLHQGNALITPDNNVAIIDPVIYLNTPEDDFEGKRTINPY